MEVEYWTVDEARLRRIHANRKYELQQKLLAPLAYQPVNLFVKLASAAAGPRVYQTILRRVSSRMNRNMDRAFQNYQPKAGDIVASAYFKAGTNWVMNMCHQIANLGVGEFDHIQDVMPWPDAAEPRYWRCIHDVEPYASPTGYRVIKSHLPASRLPIASNAKYIVVTRDPKDCAASAYHYFRDLVLGPTTPPPNDWLDFFGTEHAIFGRWDKFTAEWYALRAEPNVLFLRFETIKADPVSTIGLIADFLGIDLTSEATANIAASTSFSVMKQMNDKFYPARQSLWTDPGGQIIRKGSIGDSHTLFGSDSLSRLDDAMERGLARLKSDFPYRKLYRGTGSKIAS